MGVSPQTVDQKLTRCWMGPTVDQKLTRCWKGGAAMGAAAAGRPSRASCRIDEGAVRRGVQSADGMCVLDVMALDEP
eukprot:4161721-Prymnesium_polylepis.2